MNFEINQKLRFIDGNEKFYPYAIVRDNKDNNRLTVEIFRRNNTSFLVDLTPTGRKIWRFAPFIELEWE
jgi:hypothetical protein